MKVSDIIEAYGVRDDNGMTSSASIRTQMAEPNNQNRRANDDNKNANDEANIKSAQDYYKQKRRQYAPTGIPNRAYMQQQQELQNQGKQQ